jgi:hypothetical protein
MLNAVCTLLTVDYNSCCCRRQHSSLVQNADLVNLIQLGINSSSTRAPAAAARVLRRLPLADMPGGALAELLQTALARHAVNGALKHVAAAASDVWLHEPWTSVLTDEQLLPVLQQAVKLGGPAWKVSNVEESVFFHLHTLTGALSASSTISAATVVSSMHAAMDANSPYECFLWLKGFPAFSFISKQQLVDLLEGALELMSSRSWDGIQSVINIILEIPAIQQLESAAVTTILQSTSSAGATTAVAAPAGADRSYHLHRLRCELLHAVCNALYRQHALAVLDVNAVMQWLQPALAAAVQAGLYQEAGTLVAEAGSRLSASDFMVLLQETLQSDHTGTTCREAIRSALCMSSPGTEHVSQLLRCASSLHGLEARLGLVHSFSWKEMKAQDRLVALLPVLLPWLSVEECKQCLQAANLTAEKEASLAVSADQLWIREALEHSGCNCLAKLQAGSQVQSCRRSCGRAVEWAAAALTFKLRGRAACSHKCRGGAARVVVRLDS